MCSPTKDVVIVVVQGSFQTPLVYKPLSDDLRAHGYTVYQPELPSCSNTDDPAFPSVTLDDDSAAVETVVKRLVEDEGRTVVVVMHSYGGLAGSNAISEELGMQHRKERGKQGGVVHLYYFAAFIMGVGQSVLGTYGEGPNNDVKPDGRFYMKNGAKLLYNELPPAEAAEWEARMIPQSHAVEKTEITRAAYKYIPSTYLVCDGDQAVPPQFQEMFAQTAGSEIQRCGAGHSPMLSWREGLVEKIIGCVEKAVGEA